MKKLYGIVCTLDRKYVKATVQCDKESGCTIKNVKKWENQDLFKRFTLFHQGVYFGIKSFWKPHENITSIKEFTSVVNNESHELTEDSRSNFNILTNSFDLSIHEQTLYSNLLGIIPDDAFLASVPLSLCEDPLNSFVSIYCNSVYYCIGIIIDKKLNASFRIAPGDPEKLASHLGRIKRYWNIKFATINFPDTIIALGDSKYIPENAFRTKITRVQGIPEDEFELKAIGCALAQKEDVVPLFKNSTEGALFRKKRTWMHGISVSFVFLGIFLFTLFFGINLWYTKQKEAFEDEYNKVVVNDKEINKLLKRNNELVSTIVRLQKTLSNQTIWGKFFHTLGEGRPKDLFFERIGTDPVKDKENIVRVAIAGWTQKEGSITELIAKLQDMPYVTQITLSSMERNKKKRSIYGFKILCTLLLNEK